MLSAREVSVLRDGGLNFNTDYCSDILAELNLLPSGILQYEGLLPYPNIQMMIEEMKFPAEVINSYVAQLFLRKRMNEISGRLYNPKQNLTLEARMTITADFQKNTLDNQIIWAKNYAFHEDDPPAQDILTARYRAKFWGAHVINYRPYVEDIIGWSNNTLASIVPPMNNNADHRQKVMDALKQISYGTEQFSLEFLKRLSVAVAGVNYNFIVSPFSIWSLLVLTAEGADGDTYNQLQQVLRLPEDLSYLRMAYKHIQKSLNVNTSNVEVAINQALFSDINRPIESEYSYKLDNNYDAEHMPVNFHNADEAYNRINQYVSDQTRGKIRKIVNKDDLNDAQILLISALFFRGQWKVHRIISF